MVFGFRVQNYYIFGTLTIHKKSYFCTIDIEVGTQI